MNKTKVLLIILLVLIGILVVTSLRTHPEPETFEEIDLEELVLPANNGDLIVHNGYTLCYSEEHEQPFWVAYVLTPEEVNSQPIKRKDNFRSDPAISTESAQLSDYKGSGFDRGHLAPYADLSYSEESAQDSFYLSNMSPQEGSFNRGKWAQLEALVRTFAEEEPMCIVTGPVLTDGPYQTIGKNKVSVPNYFYKVVLDYYGDDVKATAYLLPNAKCDKDLKEYVVTVDRVEQLTGLDFFPLLPDDIENILESRLTVFN